MVIEEVMLCKMRDWAYLLRNYVSKSMVQEALPNYTRCAIAAPEGT